MRRSCLWYSPPAARRSCSRRVAEAHGIVGRADLPIPVWLFSWAAAIVLVVSFVALSALWRSPQLQSEHRKPLLQIPRGRGAGSRA